jgi:hypothetical protein
VAGTGAATASRDDKKRVILTDNAAVVKALEHFIHGASSSLSVARLHLPLRARPSLADCGVRLRLTTQGGSTRKQWTCGRSGGLAS